MTLRNIDTLFNGGRVCVLGNAATPPQQQLLANLQDSSDAPPTIVTSAAAAASLPATPGTSAVIMDADWGRPKLIAALAEAGCRSVVWCAHEPISQDVLRAARPTNLRLLGSQTSGVFRPDRGLNLSTLTTRPRPGRVALITQSLSLTAAAVDWAQGRNIGFSWVACTGTEADIDAADLLDYAALDPGTRAVVLQLSHIAEPRKFMSAARAAARIKPVMVLQTRANRPDVPAGPDPIRSAAFARAGLVECEDLVGLFDGLVALELLPGTQRDNVRVVATGGGVCAMAADAIRRAGLTLAATDDETEELLRGMVPRGRTTGVGINLSRSTTDATVALLQHILTRQKKETVLFVHSPLAGQPHAPLARALAGADLKKRLITVWLGLDTAQQARNISAAARLPTFSSVDEAARAIRYRLRYHEVHEMLTATPPPDPTVTADVRGMGKRLNALSKDHIEWLSGEDTQDILTAYGMTVMAFEAVSWHASSRHVRIRASDHPELGMVLQVTDESLGLPSAFGFAPLNPLLAQSMLSAASAERLCHPQAVAGVLTAALVRLSQLIIDLPQVAGFDIMLCAGPDTGAQAMDDALIELTDQPKAPRHRLAMAPWPARMRHRVTLRDGNVFVVRAIHPADEPIVLDLLGSLSNEEVMLRFFSSIRYFSHDMAARMTQVDYDREVSLVATRQETPDTLAGMATIIADPDGHEAEFAVLVHRPHTRSGLGRHLLDCLLRQAYARGISLVYGDILAHNRPMLNLARSMGFRLSRSQIDRTALRAEIDVATYRQHSDPG